MPKAVPAKWPDVTVIIPVVGNDERLATCLHQVAQQDYCGTLQVIVVNNGEFEATQELHRMAPASFEVEVLHEARRGSYAARNAGVQMARGDVLAFTDADTRPAQDWLSQGVRVLVEEAADLVAGPVNVQPAKEVPTPAEYYDMCTAFPIAAYVQLRTYGVTANLLAQRKAILAVQAFDASLQSGGDQDLCQRVVAGGGRIVFSARALVDHPARSSWHELTAKIRRVNTGYVGRRLRSGYPLANVVFDASRRIGRFSISAVAGGPPAPLRVRCGAAAIAVGIDAYSAWSLLSVWVSQNVSLASALRVRGVTRSRGA